MPAHIVIVHTDAAFLEAVCAALSASGKSVSGYSDAMQALDALEGATTTDVLVTRVDFGRGTLNGVASVSQAGSQGAVRCTNREQGVHDGGGRVANSASGGPRYSGSS